MVFFSPYVKRSPDGMKIPEDLVFVHLCRYPSPWRIFLLSHSSWLHPGVVTTLQAGRRAEGEEQKALPPESGHCRCFLRSSTKSRLPQSHWWKLCGKVLGGKPKIKLDFMSKKGREVRYWLVRSPSHTNGHQLLPWTTFLENATLLVMDKCNLKSSHNR